MKKTPLTPLKKAERDAMKIVKRRAISSRQMLDKLRAKGHDEVVARTVVEDLKSCGILNDVTYGRALAAAVVARKPAGKRLIVQKLYQKKLSREVVERVAGEVEATGDPAAAATELARRKLRSATLQRCDPVTRKRRLWGMLARRGFDGSAIGAAIAATSGGDVGSDDPD